MKKIIVFILAAVMCLSLAACGGDTGANNEQSNIEVSNANDSSQQDAASDITDYAGELIQLLCEKNVWYGMRHGEGDEEEFTFFEDGHFEKNGSSFTWEFKEYLSDASEFLANYAFQTTPNYDAARGLYVTDEFLLGYDTDGNLLLYWRDYFCYNESMASPDSSTPDDSSDEDSTANNETEDDVICCVLTVSINPEFTLHLNKDGIVRKVECLNDDAQKALANINVLGMSADAAVTTMLEGVYAYDSGIFDNDQPKVTIVVDMQNASEALDRAVAAVDDKVFAFADSHQIPMGYERSSAPAGGNGGGNGSGGGASTIISDSIDANGNRVVVEVDADGTRWTVVSSAETNQVLELTKVDPDGTITYCNMATNTTTVTKPDGTTEQFQGVIGKG